MFSTLDKLPLWEIGGMIGCGCGLICLLLRTNRKPHCRTYRILQKSEPASCLDCFCQCGHTRDERERCPEACRSMAEAHRRHEETERELNRR